MKIPKPIDSEITRVITKEKKLSIRYKGNRQTKTTTIWLQNDNSACVEAMKKVGFKCSIALLSSVFLRVRNWPNARNVVQTLGLGACGESIGDAIYECGYKKVENYISAKVNS